MSTSPMKTLSPAELAKLEHSFAADPSSDAYKPLAEAYLGMGRFMEAMVVCKKGVKAHPNSADPRLLLARVYLQQGQPPEGLGGGPERPGDGHPPAAVQGGAAQARRARARPRGSGGPRGRASGPRGRAGDGRAAASRGGHSHRRARAGACCQFD